MAACAAFLLLFIFLVFALVLTTSKVGQVSLGEWVCALSMVSIGSASKACVDVNSPTS